MRDGVRIAVDVWLPDGARQGGKVPTLMRMTRYWRALDIVGADTDVTKQSDYGRAQRVNNAGYAYVTVDARGTGASFGSRDYEITADEVADYGEVAAWIAAQSWSNGRVGSFGASYEGTTAEMLAVNLRPMVKAVAPLYPDFDAYNHLVYPGNVFLNFFTNDWGHAVLMMDRDDICGLRHAEGEACSRLKSQMRGVKPVDADVDGSLLRAAVADHARNVRVADAARAMEFRDDRFGIGPAHLERTTPSHHLKELAASGVPYFTRVGWLDAATVNGALSRYNSLANPQWVEIGALSHGGSHDVDPFKPADADPDPTVDAQFATMFSFFDPFLKGDVASPIKSRIHYVTLGSGEWHTTTTWPPSRFQDKAMYFAPERRLSFSVPSVAGADVYTVDFTATTGRDNRWHTQMGGEDVIYPDRSKEDEKLLVYTSEPMPRDTEITGHPRVTLYVRSTASDGAFFAYLEDVAPDGRVTYLTEGQLRAVSRKLANTAAPYHQYGPYRTFTRTDAAPLEPGAVTELTFDLWATSALIRAGHAVRVAIAGADVDSFDRYPHDGVVPVITIERSADHPSRIVLPMSAN